MTQPGFYYSLAYCACVVGFGIRRIRRRQTPYVTVQTLTLMLIQCIPLFCCPTSCCRGWGTMAIFPAAQSSSPWPTRCFPRQSGMHTAGILAQLGLCFGVAPVLLERIHTRTPGMVAGHQFGADLVIIPLLIWRWGKGAYCGWICSCGALAETMGDMHRQKMPHGPLWNKMNMVGQVIFGAGLCDFGTADCGLGIARCPLGDCGLHGDVYGPRCPLGQFGLSAGVFELPMVCRFVFGRHYWRGFLLAF